MVTLSRRKPLAPGTSRLSSRAALARYTPLRRGEPAPAPKHRAKDDDPRCAPVSNTRRELVYGRDWDTCVRCGRLLFVGIRQLQHRVPRGMGGRRDHDLPSHLVLLCGMSATDPAGCHYFVERWKTDAENGGWRVPMGQDPTRWPVHYSSTHGGGWWLLDDYGDRRRVWA